MAQGTVEQIPRKRWWLVPLIVVVGVAVLGVAAFSAYRKIAPDRMAQRAREYLAAGDYRNAVLTARRALEINPTNAAASAVMVEITEQLQVPDVVEWRRRMSELNPNSAPEALAWAATALRAGKTASAEEALAAVPESERNSASYHSKAGTLALSSGKWREAEKHYAEALRLEPANELHQYNLSTLRLQSGDAEIRKSAAEALEQMARGGRVQAFAHRALVTRLAGERQWAQALEHSTALLKDPVAQFSDRLINLEILRQLRQGDAAATALKEAQKIARTNPEHAAALLNWMRLHGLAADAAEWATLLEKEVSSRPAVAAARAECLIATQDWEALRAVVETEPWESSEELRLAFLARVLREQGDLQGARARWTGAVTIGAKNRESASRLAFLAVQWGWNDEAREPLWAAASGAAPQWALHILHRLYQMENDTTGLLRVATRLLEVEPGNDEAANNVAMLSLLLGRDRDAALRSAQALHQKASGNAAFASTYALALHLSGRSGEAVEVMQKLGPAPLRDPAVAAYYGLFLSATGARDTAGEFIELGKRATLLPEEKELIAPSWGI